MMKKILSHNLVLDLDEVLLHRPSQKPEKEHYFFSNKDSFLAKDSYGYHYIVPAYLSEFLHFAVTTFNVHFFSAGDKERNRSVVEDIWARVFNTSKPENVTVLSREDLTSTDRDEELQPEYDGEIHWSGNYKKDITKIGPLQNTILVDDDPSYVIRNQKQNFLKVPCSLMSSYFFQEDVKKVTQGLKVEDRDGLDDLLVFYKLLYITGILERASLHKSSLVEGLSSIFYENGKPKFYDRMKEIDYYKRGYSILSAFSKGTVPSYFFEVESRLFHEPKKLVYKEQELSS